jgi:hypothetical protein
MEDAWRWAQWDAFDDGAWRCVLGGICLGLLLYMLARIMCRGGGAWVKRCLGGDWVWATS